MKNNLQIGYGIKFTSNAVLEEAFKDSLDMEFLLMDHYPLLEWVYTGHADLNGRSSNTPNNTLEDFVVIKSSLLQGYSVYTFEIPDTNRVFSDAELKQLKELCDRFGFTYRPVWRVFEYLF